MSISQQVDDAKFLAQNNRHLGALTTLMLAVAASSRLCFPKGTKSIDNPTEIMGDREAFTQFLGGRIKTILFTDPSRPQSGPQYGTSGISVSFKGKQYDVAFLLYKYYRCELVHEAELPQDVEFIPPDPSHFGVPIGRGQLGVTISGGDKLVFDYGFIDLLVKAVVEAPCNGVEFGIDHFQLVEKSNVAEADFRTSMIDKYGITPGRLFEMKDAARLITPELINASEDIIVTYAFWKLVISGAIQRATIGAFEDRHLTDRDGHLSSKGLALLREIAGNYTWSIEKLTGTN